jgi:uncharacterized protein (TIGR03546 family)
MLLFLNLPAKIVEIFDSNYSAGEVAAGVCMGMFMGFLPLNGPFAVILFACFFVFRINRLAAMMVLPVFKLIYFLGFYKLTDMAGGLILIDAGFLAGFWRVVTHFPVLALLELNNTLVAGGIAVCSILTVPLYFMSKRSVEMAREKFFSKIKGSRFVGWFKKLPIINKVLPFIARVRGGD